MKSIRGRLQEARKREEWLSRRLVEVRAELMRDEQQLEKLRLDIATLEEQLAEEK